MAAKSEFAERGYSGARTEEIAQNAKINKAMLFYYFGSKEKLYQSVIRIIFEVSEIRFSEAYRNLEEMPPGQKLHFFLRFMARYNQSCTDPEFSRIIVWEMAEKKNNIQLLADHYFLPRIKVFAKLIEEGVLAGDFESTNPLFDVMHFVAFFNFTSMHRHLLGGTQLYKHFYSDKLKKEWEEHTVHFLYRSVANLNNGFEIPPLTKQQEDVLNNLVHQLKEQNQHNYQYFITALNNQKEVENEK